MTNIFFMQFVFYFILNLIIQKKKTKQTQKQINMIII